MRQFALKPSKKALNYTEKIRGALAIRIAEEQERIEREREKRLNLFRHKEDDHHANDVKQNLFAAIQNKMKESNLMIKLK